MRDYNTIVEMVNESGGKIENGINWDWALFDQEEAARAFNKTICANGWETRGVYPPLPHGDDTWGVRFR